MCPTCKLCSACFSAGVVTHMPHARLRFTAARPCLPAQAVWRMLTLQRQLDPTASSLPTHISLKGQPRMSVQQLPVTADHNQELSIRSKPSIGHKAQIPCSPGTMWLQNRGHAGLCSTALTMMTCENDAADCYWYSKQTRNMVDLAFCWTCQELTTGIRPSQAALNLLMTRGKGVLCRTPYHAV